MIPITLSVILIIAIIYSISIVVQKRKKAGITGIKKCFNFNLFISYCSYKSFSLLV